MKESNVALERRTRSGKAVLHRNVEAALPTIPDVKCVYQTGGKNYVSENFN